MNPWPYKNGLETEVSRVMTAITEISTKIAAGCCT